MLFWLSNLKINKQHIPGCIMLIIFHGMLTTLIIRSMAAKLAINFFVTGCIRGTLNIDNSTIKLPRTPIMPTKLYAILDEVWWTIEEEK